MGEDVPERGLTIEMLPARHGDCLWVEWGPAGDRHRMLIDGGPKATGKELVQRLRAMDRADRRFDLVIVTHIDLDHIDGVVRVLRTEDLDLQIDDLWFNDHRHTVAAGKRGAIQGEYLAAVIEHQQIPWNVAFAGGAVVAPDDADLPVIDLPGGLRLTVLSPTPEKLKALRKTWEKTLEKEGMTPGDRAAALDRLDAKGKRGGSRTKFGGDSSAANGSSIAVLAEYGDERWLLAGDAHADALLAGLDRFAASSGGGAVRLDGFKVPHHGSVANLTPALLDRIDCDRFLISTNGAYFKHPDPTCIDALVASTDRAELVFNYRTEFTEPWATTTGRYTSTYTNHVPRGPIAAAPPAPRPTSTPVPDSGVTLVSPRADATGAASIAPPDTTETPDRTIDVEVFHGSLEASDHPVMVGHYLATRLGGAEHFVDQRLERRLSDRVAHDAYPGRIGESLRVRAQRRGLPHQGALVVGLGEYGELTPLRLVQAVREALVRHALDVADGAAERDGPMSLGIATVAVGGTGEQGLGISGSIRAILGAVCEANADLRSPGLRTRARYDEVQIWERNAPEAELAYRAVIDVAAEMADERAFAGPSTEIDVIECTTQLVEAEGGLRSSLPVESGEPSWWRVQVSGVGEDGHELELDFTVGGRLARTGNVRHVIERRRLERLLQGAVTSTTPGAGLHATLFELLFPNQLKWDLMAAQDIQLEVDDLTADIPWEMLAARNPDGGTRGELALRAPLVRQLRLPDLATIRRSPKPTALVLGNPPVGALAAPLPGAANEAAAVERVLGRVYDVRSLVFDDDATATSETTGSIETALFADDYRIVHIAAHGMFQPDDPTRTGVAIGEDDFLTARMFGQLNIVPDLVFLNCCHLGGVAHGLEDDRISFTRQNLNRLGASLARQLIDSGVRAVVVAGWAVGDAAAEAFASTFYDQLLAGEAFGSAVHEARKRARSKAIELGIDDDSTWGAYQCYGDSGYRLPNETIERTTLDEITRPVTRREFLRRLEELVAQLETTGLAPEAGATRWWATNELWALEAAAEDRGWLRSRSGWALQELARGFAAIDDTHKAIALLEQALADPHGLATIDCMRQVAVLKARHAVDLVRTSDDQRQAADDAARLFDESFGLVETLEALAGGTRRWALRATLHKRRSTTVAGDDRLSAITEAADDYLESHREQGRVYALANHHQLSHLRRLLSGSTDARPHLQALAVQLGDRDDFRTGSFWHVVASADQLLTLAMVADDIPARLDDLVDLYVGAFNSRSTAAQRSSVRNHLRDLAELHPDDEATAALEHLVTVLRRDDGTAR